MQSAHGAADALEDVGEGVLMVDDGGNERGGELKGGYGRSMEVQQAQ